MCVCVYDCECNTGRASIFDQRYVCFAIQQLCELCVNKLSNYLSKHECTKCSMNHDLEIDVYKHLSNAHSGGEPSEPTAASSRQVCWDIHNWRNCVHILNRTCCRSHRQAKRHVQLCQAAAPKERGPRRLPCSSHGPCQWMGPSLTFRWTSPGDSEFRNCSCIRI